MGPNLPVVLMTVCCPSWLNRQEGGGAVCGLSLDAMVAP